MPNRVGKYDVTDDTTFTALQDVFNNAGSGTDMIIPRTAEVDIIDGKTSNANGELQEKFINNLDQNLSIIVLGNTETTTNGKNGSNAKSKTHSEQQNQITKSDMMLLQAYLNDPHFTKILQSYGIPVSEDGNFEFNKDIDISFLTERAGVDQILVQSGVEIGDNYWRETYNIPTPEAGEKTVGGQPAPTGKTPSPLERAGVRPLETDLSDNTTSPSLADVSKMLDEKLKSFFGHAL